MKKALFFPLQVSLCTVGCLYASSGITQAQVTSDGTLDTQVTQDGNVAEITGGETRGSNLFHSFQDFSVPTSNEAFFNNANDISNIFSRVTGGNISNIDGAIRANGSASLFLINPAGILFGENARLDIGGSFYGSSASSILFEGGEFSAADLENPPLLTVNAPIGLGFRDNPGDITIRGDGNGARLEESEVIDTQNALRVGSNATVGIIGGNVLFEDATVKTAGGRIEIGSVAEGTVDLIEVDNGFTFDYSAVETFKDIFLSGRSNIDASGLGGGDIKVAGNSISITGVSGFTSFTLGSNPGEDINIFAADSLEISGVENELEFVSGIFSRTFPGSTGNAGNINIETGSLSMGDLALINTSVSGQGNAGNININASDSITLSSQGNTSAIFSGVSANAIGNGGNVDITTSSLSVNNGAFVLANTSGQGDAGNITIDSISLSLTNGSFLSANANSSQGDAGNITVNANETVSLDGQGTGFATNVRTAETIGNGGDIDIITGSLTISNQALLNVTSGGQGDAGNIAINSNSLLLTNGSSLSANTRAEGNAGTISIDSANIAINGQDNSEVSTGLFSNVGSEAIGNGGNINITTELFTLSNRAAIDITSLGEGNGGNVTIKASNSIALEGNDPSSSKNTAIRTFVNGENAQGNAGNIELTTSSLSLNNGTGLLAANFANGQAGNVTINATEDVSFNNNSEIFVTGTPGGSIDLSAKNLSITSASNFFAGANSENSSSEAQTGNITINLEEDLVLDVLESNESTFITNSSFGTGNPGDIEINARNITFQNGGNITAFSEEQETVQIGNVTLNATGDITFDGISGFLRSGILNFIPENSSGSIGDISVTAQNLTITNGAAISSQVSGNGDSGNINLDIANSIKVDAFGEATTSTSSSFLGSEISSNIISTGTGNAGTINIDTQNLKLSRNGIISADLTGIGNGGNININAEQISIGEQGDSSISPSFISAETFFDTEGNGGNININTGSLSISDGGDIDVGIAGVGDGGNIIINASDFISVDGTGTLRENEVSSGILSSALNSGNAGDIEINTPIVSVTNDALISADVLGDNTTGNGGDVTINTQILTVTDGSQISATTFGDGNAGSLTITATESIDLSGSTEFMAGIFSSALEGSGNGGDVIISTGDLTISNGAIITASNFSSRSEENGGAAPGTGEPGEITITANSLNLSNEGRLEAATQSATGEGANINLQVSEDITLRGDSFISAQAINQGNGGNLSIDSRFIIAFPDGNNDILASAEQGQGGNITINAESLLGIQERTPSNLTNDINASSQVSGLDGTISISTPDTNPIQGATELPTDVIVPEQTSQQACQANRETVAKNGFTIKGKGGIVPEPGLPLNSFNITVNGQTNPTSTTSAPIETSQGKIQPARGIKVTESGQLILTAYQTNNSGERIPEIKQNCDRV